MCLFMQRLYHPQYGTGISSRLTKKCGNDKMVLYLDDILGRNKVPAKQGIESTKSILMVRPLSAYNPPFPSKIIVKASSNSSHIWRIEGGQRGFCHNGHAVLNLAHNDPLRLASSSLTGAQRSVSEIYGI